MMGNAETDAPVTVTFDDADDVHPETVAFAGVLYGAAEVLELLKETPDADLLAAGWTQEHVNQFENAFRTGRDVLDHEAWPEALWRDGLDALPADLEGRVRSAMAPVAPVFGVDLEGETDRSVPASVLRPLDYCDDWRRSA